MQARYLIKVKRSLYLSTSPQRPFVDVEHSWFVEQGVNEQIDLWNTLVDVERMQANRANVRKIAHLTTLMGGGYGSVWNKENAMENHENQPKLEKKQNFKKHRQW